MIPKHNSYFLNHDFVFKEKTSKTYRLNIEKGEIKGYLDELEAVKQGIYLILNVERYKYVIYSWNYGVELNDLYGKTVSYIVPEVKRRIKEALLQDTRILDVRDFNFDMKKGKLSVIFVVSTIFGDAEIKKEVKI